MVCCCCCRCCCCCVLRLLQTRWVQDPGQKADALEQPSSAKPQPQADGDEDGTSTAYDYKLPVTDEPDAYSVPSPSEVGVHDGFDDLYNRRIDQPGYTERMRALGPLLSVRDGKQDEDSPQGRLSPREVRVGQGNFCENQVHCPRPHASWCHACPYEPAPQRLPMISMPMLLQQQQQQQRCLCHDIMIAVSCTCVTYACSTPACYSTAPID
jgi:hypothetical protein